MKDDQFRFMSVFGKLPGRLNAEQAAWVLNCQPHDIPALVNARLIKPLGNPAAICEFLTNKRNRFTTYWFEFTSQLGHPCFICVQSVAKPPAWFRVFSIFRGSPIP
jgi:hypothetical protein